MSESFRLKRAELLAALSLAKPAVGRALFVPVLSHFCFTGTGIYAYDDSIAITVNTPTGVECAVPADLLLRLLSSMTAEDVTLAFEGSGGLRVSCGKTKVKLPALPRETFIFAPPEAKAFAWCKVTPDLLKGIAQVLVSVGVDQTHPAQMGVTLQAGVLYSTDNVTMSRYKLSDPGNTPEEPVILPTAFCRELLSLAAKSPESPIEAVLSVYDQHVEVVWGSWARLFGKVVTNEVPLDFDSAFARMMSGKASRVSTPASWESMFTRAAAVTDAAAPRTRMDVEDGVLTLETTSRLGEVRDVATLRSAPDASAFYVDPLHVLRACKSTDTFGCYREALVLESEAFTHLISHCNE